MQACYRGWGGEDRGPRFGSREGDFAGARVAVLEEGRRERARDVKLERVGRGLYRANDRYLVDAIFGLCGCRNFKRHNGEKKRKKEEPGVPLVVVRCKHLIAAEEAKGGATFATTIRPRPEAPRRGLPLFPGRGRRQAGAGLGEAEPPEPLG